MIEEVVDEIKAVLEEHLQSELSALGVADTVRRFLIAEEDIPPAELPAIFILPQSSREQNWLNAQHDEIHSIFIVALCQHVNTQALGRAAMKYKSALRRALKKNLPKAPAETIFRLTVIRHDYAPIQEIENSAEFSKAVQLEIEAAERVGEA